MGRREDGQVIVEYILMLAVAATLLGLMARGFRTTIFKVWETWTQEIAAPCPDCRKP